MTISPYLYYNDYNDYAYLVYPDGDVFDGGNVVDWDSCGLRSPNFNFDNRAYIVNGGGYVGNVHDYVGWDSCGRICLLSVRRR